VPFAVRSVEDKPYTRKPYAPFMTSTLQQEGGRKLRFSAQRVMQTAQRLYENGYITYMRTDSTNLSETAVNAARSRPATSTARVRAGRPAPLRRQGQERAGGARGDPPLRRRLPHPGELARELSATSCASTS
jgi:DNA topoisomerase-1